MWWLTTVLPATWETEIRRINNQGQSQQKLSEASSQPTKHNEGTCNPRYVGSIGRKNKVQCRVQAKKCKTLSEK
jgi:hypothetical protein